MSQNFLQLYIEQTKKLAKTLVIKSKVSAELINEYLISTFGDADVDLHNMHSWKYYLNLAGEYHPRDKIMYVTSLDTLNKIVFSKVNLKTHTATKEAYLYGTRYFYSLLKEYPDQEQLIMGILYPSDIDKAIEAEDGSILTYPSDLVEEQEVTLISELETWIKRFNVRWNVPSYNVVDNLYHTAQHAILYLNLVPKILNLRLKRCKTNEAHTFHIREYLTSHGRLDKYFNYMTLKQKLFFYRNIRYLERNSGKVEQFNLLIEKLFTDRKLPLSEFTIRHKSIFEDNYDPVLSVRRKVINSFYNIPETDYYDINTLYEKEIPLATGNRLYFETYKDDITHKFSTCISSVEQSKVLETSTVDYSDAVPDPLEKILMRQWAYMSGHNLYNAIVNFKDPSTSETRSLYAMDAFIYMYYVTLNSIGVKPSLIPTYFTLKYRRYPLPTKEDILSVVDLNMYPDLEDLAIYLLERQPDISKCLSISTFYNTCYKLFEESYLHWFIISATEDQYKRAMIQNMIYRLYALEFTVYPSFTTNINDWLDANNLPRYNFTVSQAEELTKDIFMTATGMEDIPEKLVKNIQKAMTNILQQLSSYSIQVLTNINDSDVVPVNWGAIRMKTVDDDLFYSAYLEIGSYVHDYRAYISESKKLETNVNKGHDSLEEIINSNIPIDIKMSCMLDYDETRTIPIRFYTLLDNVKDDDDDEVNIIPGNTQFNLLTEDQLKTIKTIY